MITRSRVQVSLSLQRKGWMKNLSLFSFKDVLSFLQHFFFPMDRHRLYRGLFRVADKLFFLPDNSEYKIINHC